MNENGDGDTALETVSAHTQKHLNGGKRNSLSYRASMEKIGSVQENPFFTKFGLKQAPISARSRVGSDARGRRLSSNGSLDGEEDQLEYKPGSGFVNKLRDKWSHLNSPREDAGLKKASSLEELAPAEDEASKVKVTSPRVTNNNVNLSVLKHPNALHPPRLAYRAQSVETLHQVHKKPHSNHHRPGHHHQHPQFVHQLRHVDGGWMKDKSTAPPLKSPRGTHIEAPDVDLGRDDIILIEKTSQPQVEDGVEDESESESSDGSPPLSYREEMLPNEMPKPNTVQTVRNIFETNSSRPSLKSSVYPRRRPSDTPPASLPLSTSTAHTELPHALSPGSSESGVSIRGFSPLISPRMLNTSDSYAKPILSPPAINAPNLPLKLYEHSKSSTDSSYSHYSRGRSGSSSLSGPSEYRDKIPQPSTTAAAVATPTNVSESSSSSPSATAEAKPTSVTERSNFFESPRLGETRPSPSPRSMASVTPVVSSKPSTYVKPLTMTTPASAATSYKGSSPVVPVAPFKDKKDDSKDDDGPRMIFSKSKLSPKREKTPRINNYAPVSEPPKGLPSENLNKTNKENVIANKDFKAKLNNREAKAETQRPDKVASVKDRPTAAEKKSPEAETDKIIQTPQQTTIQIGSSKAAAVSADVKNDKPGSNDTVTVRPSALAAKRTQAPVAPTADKVKSKVAPQPPGKKESEAQPQSMIYISSSESGESDVSSPPETPRTRDVSKSGADSIKPARTQDEIKGVPSLITVSRLKEDSGPAPPRFSGRDETGGPSPAVPSYPAKSSLSSSSSENKTAVTTSAPTVANRAPSFPSLYQSKAVEKEPVLKDTTATVSKPTVSASATSTADEPIKGIPSIIANRLRQTSADPSQVAQNVVSNGTSNNFLRLDGNLNDESSTDSDASPRPVLNKPKPLQSSSSSSSSPGADPGKDAVSSEIANEIEAVRRKMESAKKTSSVAQIFDSSQLAKKRKERQQQKAAAQAAAAQQAGGIVPKLDLSGIDDDRSKVYMPPQKEIKPCNIKFIGENAKTSRSLLVKKRVKKVSDSVRAVVEWGSLVQWAILLSYLSHHVHLSLLMLYNHKFALSQRVFILIADIRP